MKKKTGNILIVDDNRNVLSTLRLMLSDVFEKAIALPSPKQMLSTIAEEEIHAVLLDMNFVAGINTGNEGLFWLRKINQEYPSVQVVLFTAYADIELAVKAMKEGAFDFVEKPWDNRKMIETLENACLRYRTIEKESAVPDSDDAKMIWGTSPSMTALRKMVGKVAVTNANILITGENGTGKDVLAHEIHRMSQRSDRPIVNVDMGAISETLFESELFGHVKGAFTDAKSDRKGMIEEADGSTLFLDEIGNLPLHQQAKLLNVLQRRCVIRVGSNTQVPVDIRLICATNKNLNAMIAQGSFREDLLYRINTIHLILPPLRERQSDIIPLAERFLRHFARYYAKPVQSLTDEAKNALTAHRWTGNIRELRHTIEKAVIMADTRTIDTTDLQLQTDTTSSPDPEGTIEAMECTMIKNAIGKYAGNLSAVAFKLGISRQTLYNKMKRYGIEP